MLRPVGSVPSLWLALGKPAHLCTFQETWGRCKWEAAPEDPAHSIPPLGESMSKLVLQAATFVLVVTTFIRLS